MHQERRQERSEHYPRALRYQLQQTAQRLGAKDVLLAGHEGFLILATSDSDNADDLAAMSCKMGQSQGFWQGHYHQPQKQHGLAVQRVQTLHGDMYLCAVDAAHKNSLQIELDRSAQGVARILATHF